MAMKLNKTIPKKYQKEARQMSNYKPIEGHDVYRFDGIKFSEKAIFESEYLALKQQVESMKNCDNCKHRNCDMFLEPCDSCGGYEKWEPITEEGE